MCLILAITNAVAAPPIKYSLTSSLSSSSLLVPSSVPSSVATNAPSNSLLQQTFFQQSPAFNSRQQRKRHSKRNSLRYGQYDLNENSTILEWVNPCGGYYDPSITTTTKKPKSRNQKNLKKLKQGAVQEITVINERKAIIETDDIEIWSTHKVSYKFLPKLKLNLNSTIALQRWYRNMQTYVASFAYLRRRQLNWDLLHIQRESETAGELNILLTSSRSILCELENSLNKTHPNKELPQVTREKMNKRLKFKTRDIAINKPNEIQETNSIDLKFVKYYYLEFLNNMLKILRVCTRRNGQKGPEQFACHENRKKLNGGKRKINDNNKKRNQRQYSSNNFRRRKT